MSQLKKAKNTNGQENLLGENTILTLSIEKGKIDEEYQKVLRTEASKITLKGFRKGKAPLSLAEATLGSDKLMEHALNHLLPHAYQDEVIKAKITPLVRPEIKAKEMPADGKWVFSAETAVAPAFELGDYKKLIAQGSAKYDQKLSETKDAKENDDERLQHIFVSLIGGVKPKIAPLLLQEEMSQQLSQLYQQLKSRKIELESYIKSQGKTEEEFRNDLAAVSLGALQLEFVLQALTKELGLKVSPEDIQEWIKSQGYPEKTKIPEDLLARLQATLLRRKTTDQILKLAKAQ